jgi:tRNA-Thr(GGU) m(6)t(6)A37 methyltransferase TsaA
MEGSELSICFKPIGVVESGIKPKNLDKSGKSKYEIISIIRVFDEYIDGLHRLDEYSHIFILYYLDRVGEQRLRVRPWGRGDLEEVGIFATRFPPRPNPIGLTLCKLVGVEEPIISVRGLDAFTGSLVLDIKPYDYYDIAKSPTVPRWFLDKWDEYKRIKGYDKIAPWLGP